MNNEDLPLDYKEGALHKFNGEQSHTSISYAQIWPFILWRINVS